MKYEVEVEVCYIYGIEASDKREAEILAQIECTIASICVELVEPGNTPTEHAQLPPPGYFQP